MRTQGPPKIGGVKGFFDTVARSFPLGAAIEGAIPGSTGSYERQLRRAEGDEAGALDRESTRSQIELRKAETTKALRETPARPESLDQESAEAVEELVKGGMSRVDAIQKVRPQQKPDKPSSEQDKTRYMEIQQRQQLKKPVSPEDSAWAKSYEKASTLGPAVTAAAAGTRQEKSFDQQEKMFKLRQEALTSATKTMIETAPTITQLADKVEPLIDKLSTELGPAAGRWSEFWAGKVGTKDPAYTQLRTDVGLLRTALMRMHMGARGSTQMMDYFKNLIDQGKQDPENLKAALLEIRSYAEDLKAKGIAGGMSRDVLNPPTAAPATPTRPKGVPENAVWNPQARQWQLPPQ